jgi:lipopolysaccharide biosynthesis regulator YciM
LRAFWRAPGSRGGPRPGGLAAQLRRALLAVMERDLGEAEEALRSIVAADSEEHDAYLALARIYRERGELGRAIRVHQNLLLRPDLPKGARILALRGLAEDFRKGGFLERSVASLHELLAAVPADVRALESLLKLQRELRQYDAALETLRRLQRARDTGRRDPEARREEAALLVEAAEADHQDGKAEEAERRVRRAVRLDPESAAGWTLLGELETERGRSRKALAAWQHVAELDVREAARIYPRLRSAFASLGRAREYEELLGTLAERHSEDAAVRIAQATAQAERGDRAAAVATLERLLERDPEHLGALAALGRLRASTGSHAEACSVLLRLLDAAEEQGLLASRERAVE